MSLLSSLLSNPGKHIAFSHHVTFILPLLYDFPWGQLNKQTPVHDRWTQTTDRETIPPNSILVVL